MRALVACQQSLVAKEFSQHRHRSFRLVIASLQIGATAQRRVQRKHFETGNNQKRVYPVRLESKTGTAWNQVKNTLEEPRDWPKTNRTRFQRL